MLKSLDKIKWVLVEWNRSRTQKEGALCIQGILCQDLKVFNSTLFTDRETV